MSNATSNVVLIAGGGTGGHVFPGIAIADELRRRDPSTEVVFVGTERGLEARVVPARGYRLELVGARPLKRVGFWRAAVGAAIASREMVNAGALVRRLSPRFVLCLGGYAGGPLSLMASLMRIPLFLFEPNSVVGLTNRLLARFARRAYVAWPEVEARFPRGVGVALGVPIRAEFTRASELARKAPFEASGEPRVLCVGGSQGARFLNETVPAALAVAKSRGARFSVVHQCGKDQSEGVRARYVNAGIGCVVREFMDDMAGELLGADLVIGRAGAVSIAEVCAVGRASVLIPLPTAADDHQAKNAAVLGARGAALVVSQSRATADSLGAPLHALLTSNEARRTMAEQAHALGRPDATARIVDDMIFRLDRSR